MELKRTTCYGSDRCPCTRFARFDQIVTPCKAITQPIAVSVIKHFTLATGLTRLRANRKQEVIDPAVKQICRDRPVAAIARDKAGLSTCSTTALLIMVSWRLMLHNFPQRLLNPCIP